MEDYTVRLASERDLDTIMPIYDNARAFMAANGNPGQWINGYPSRDTILEDIRRGVSYMMFSSGSELLGVFSFIIGEDPTYGYVENGEWLNDGPYGTIHRIASAGRGSGFGRRVIEWCSSKVPNLRADTHEANLPMRKLLIGSGFHHCGTIYLLNGSPRLAFHKVID